MTRYGWVFDVALTLWCGGVLLLCGLCLYGVVLAFRMKGGDGMSYKARCPQCNEWMEVERVDNGVMMVWHGVHCGWGQADFADEDVHKNEAT